MEVCCVFIWESVMAPVQNDIPFVITGKVKIKRLWLHGASNIDAGYDMDVAIDIGDQRERCNHFTGGYL